MNMLRKELVRDNRSRFTWQPLPLNALMFSVSGTCSTRFSPFVDSELGWFLLGYVELEEAPVLRLI